MHLTNWSFSNRKYNTMVLSKTNEFEMYPRHGTRVKSFQVKSLNNLEKKRRIQQWGHNFRFVFTSFFVMELISISRSNLSNAFNQSEELIFISIFNSFETTRIPLSLIIWNQTFEHLEILFQGSLLKNHRWHNWELYPIVDEALYRQ